MRWKLVLQALFSISVAASKPTTEQQNDNKLQFESQVGVDLPQMEAAVKNQDGVETLQQGAAKHVVVAEHQPGGVGSPEPQTGRVAGQTEAEIQEGAPASSQGGTLQVEKPAASVASEQPDSTQQEIGSVDVEQLVHGKGAVHAYDDTKVAPEEAELPTGKDGTPEVEELVHGTGEGHVHERKDILSGDIGTKDVEELVHGKGHVHDEITKESGNVEIGTVNAEELLHGEGEAHIHEKQVTIGTMDTEQLVHGEGHAHVHDPDRKVVNTNDLPSDKPIGPKTGEELVHDLLHSGDGHSADENIPGKKITKKDILGLGITEEELKYLDLAKLLKKDKEEYNEYKKSLPENSQSLWEQINDIKLRYTGSEDQEYSADKNPENFEWVDEMSSWPAHEEEDSVEHQMEMMGNTAPVNSAHNVHRGNRKLVHDET